MSDEQFETICKKIDNVANVIVIVQMSLLVPFALIIYLLSIKQ